MLLNIQTKINYSCVVQYSNEQLNNVNIDLDIVVLAQELSPACTGNPESANVLPGIGDPWV